MRDKVDDEQSKNNNNNNNKIESEKLKEEENEEEEEESETKDKSEKKEKYVIDVYVQDNLASKNDFDRYDTYDNNILEQRTFFLIRSK